MRHRQLSKVILAGVAALFLTACASSGPVAEVPVSNSAKSVESQPPKPKHAPAAKSRSTTAAGPSQTGLASWYGQRYHGRRTASGERFNMNAATAAHPTLPFGTHVRVTNLANGRSTVLRINDRGPFVKRRIIDVSRAAAGKLGFINDGLTRVRVQVVSSPG